MSLIKWKIAYGEARLYQPITPALSPLAIKITLGYLQTVFRGIYKNAT